LEGFPTARNDDPKQVPQGPDDTTPPAAGPSTAAKEVKSAAGHGGEAIFAPSREDASMIARRVFDTPGKNFGSVDPLVVDARDWVPRQPVLPPPEKQTPAVKGLVEKLQVETKKVETLTQKVQELEQLPPTPDNQVRVAEARIETKKAEQKRQAVVFHLNEALEEAPPVPDKVKEPSHDVPPPPAPDSGAKTAKSGQPADTRPVAP
jgi:hypothetical protein